MMHLAFFVFLHLCICNGYLLPWQQGIPLQEIVEVRHKDAVKNIYDSDLKLPSVPVTKQKSYEISHNGGENCGKKGTDAVIVVKNVTLPDVLVLGGTATFSASVTVNRLVKDISLLSVVMQKVGIPGDIPCTHNVGSCKYNNPCDLLKAVKKCPEIIKSQGWNCRCPLVKKTLAVSDVTLDLPTVPLPAFLVDGKYDAKFQLFNGSEELFCYKIRVMVKEK